MGHHVNGWEQTYEISGQKFCHCGHWLPALRYRWKGETEQACTVSCLLAKALREELVCSDA